ncbi:MAG: glycosyltransferase family 4 protein [Mycobacterium sp.]|nr:glycosyltransferase family 4 protein [Mycobacterium sp.]
MTAPLRIALIAPNRFPIRQPFAGGLEAHVWHLARALARLGHLVTLFAAPGSEPGPEYPSLAVEALTRSNAAAQRFPLPGAVIESDHHAYLTLMAELAQHGAARFDVIHNHSLHQIPIALAARLRTPMVTTLHTPPFTWLEAAIAASGGRGGTFATVSRHTGAAWARVIGEVSVVPNGIDLRGWPMGPGGQELVWFGRITPEKGPHFAIEAARRCGRHLVLAGPIGNQDYFRDAIRPRLGKAATYAGHLDQRQLAALVGHSAAALVTPLWDEPYGLVVAEALACGTPVVAFARGGIPEVVDARSGRVVPNQDVAAMAAAVTEVVGLSRSAVRDRAIANCCAHTMVASYLDIYRNVIAEQDITHDDRLLRTPSRPRASQQSVEHLRTPA